MISHRTRGRLKSLAVAVIVALGWAAPVEAVQCGVQPCPQVNYTCNTLPPVTPGCAAITGCAVGCPATSVTLGAEMPECFTGLRLDQSCLQIPRFDTLGGTVALRGVAIKVETRPTVIAYQFENFTPQSVSVSAGNNDYAVFGYLDVLDPTQPGVPGAFLSQTSNKVEGVPGATPCLNWRVAGSFSPTPVIPPFDNCLDFNDPTEPGCAGAHGGPCAQFPDSVTTGCACTPPVPGCCPTSGPLGGTRTKFGHTIAQNANCTASVPIPPPFPASGFTDKREYTAADTYTCTRCITDPTALQNVFSGAGQVDFPINADGILDPMTFNGGGVIERRLVKMTCRITVTYYYCPVPPTCQPKTAELCRTVNSSTLIDALQGATVGGNPNCPGGGLDCSLLGVSTPTYGTAQWVTVPGATANTLCPDRVIRYTLTSLPPANCTADTFTYTICRPGGCCSTCTVTVNIGDPVANPETVEACRTIGSTYCINVLGNDTICSSRTLTTPPASGSAGITQCSFGTAEWVSTNGCGTNPFGVDRWIKFTVTSLPPANCTACPFTYSITDSAGCTATGNVTVNIGRPVANTDTVEACRTLNSTYCVNVLGNDSVCPTRTLVSPPASGSVGITQCAFGTAEWISTNGCGTNPFGLSRWLKFTLTSLPPANCTSCAVSYTITDSAGCSTLGTVNVNIGDPVAGPETVEVCRTVGSTYCVNVLSNDSVCSTRTLVSPPASGTTGITQCSFGTAEWISTNGCGTNPFGLSRWIKFTLNTLPPANCSQCTFTYPITDSAGCTTTGTVTLNIGNPVAGPETVEVCRTIGSTYCINVLGNDSVCSTRTLVSPPASGSAGITQCSFGTAEWISTNGCGTNPFGLSRWIKFTLNSLPPANCTQCTFTYPIVDSAGCTATGTVTLNIGDPVANPETVEACRTVGSTYCINVLANDTVCTPRTLVSPPSSGTTGITQCSFGTAEWISTNGCGTNPFSLSRWIKFTLNSLPPANCTACVFTYRITDSAGCFADGSVTVNIGSPVCAADCGDVCAVVGSTDTIDVLKNDTSCRALVCPAVGIVDLTQPTYGMVEWITDPNCTNTLCPTKCVKYTLTSVPPNNAMPTTDTFNYTIRDSSGCTATCPVTVRICKVVANDDTPPPACQGLTQRICILSNDVGTCGTLDCNNITIETPPAHGTLQFGSGAQCNSAAPDMCGTTPPICSGCCLLYTPANDYVGTDTFTYRLTVTSPTCDQPPSTITCTDTASVSITIKPSPIAQNDAYMLDMNGQVGPFDVRDNDSPGTGCQLVGCGAACTYQGCPTIIQQPTHGTVTIDPVTCRMTYTATPGVMFPREDSFCYKIFNNCGCCASACVRISDCPCINRRNPGSLLLYPEFDNRQGMLTMLTIANESCRFPSFAVDVEFVYIDKETCMRTVRTAHLTPCDQLTLFTSAHNAQFERGYVYAFAKDAQGRAIAFDHLIGDLMIFSATGGADYGVNPLTFRSPRTQFDLTDVDLDQIRDLDGVEYEGVPERVLIPRFLGQDPLGAGAMYRDELVLIALSGGESFTTKVDIQGYNDNEMPFSADHTFFCWDKRLLMEISGSFGNDFLKSLGDNPLEILGSPVREAGWFSINGNRATSSAEIILDPAVYAFLIEHTGGLYKAAELPWEVCVQNNGDLLPKGVAGDGPDFVTDDNE